MNTPSTDLALLLEKEGVGSLGLGTILPGAGVGIFVGEEPPEPSESVTLYTYGGTVRDGINCGEVDDFRLQVRARARTYESAFALVQAVEKAINRLCNYEVADGADTVYYNIVYRLQPAVELGRDEKHRFVFTQNFAGVRQKINA